MTQLRILDDEQAVISPVSNVLTIGITTVLILGLIIGATGLLDDQQQRTARSELRTVGESLAVELERVAVLAQRGGSPDVTTQHVGSIAGSQYRVKLLHGSECDTYRTSAGTCLRLQSSRPEVTQYVPVNNKSSVNLYLESDGQGEFDLSARTTGGSSASTRSVDISDTDVSSRIGVGEDITRGGITLTSEPGNRPPIARFTYTPASPQSNDNIEFDASRSFDSDGSIDEYLWDFNGDGAYETTTTTPIVTRSLPAGNYDVALRVVDNSDGSSDQERFVDVSGLAYNGDLRTVGGDDTVEFTLTNNFGSDVEIVNVHINPANDDIDEVDRIEISATDDGEEDDDTEIYNGGRIVELDDPAEIDPGTDATVRLENFDQPVDREQITLGVQYKLNNGINSTQFTDTVNGVSIQNYRLSSVGQDVDVSFESTEQLDRIRVDYGGAGSGTLTESDFSRTSTAAGYEYTADISDGTSGYFWAELTDAETTTTDSQVTPLNDSAVTSSGTYVWTTSGDWDAATAEAGVVHADFGDRDGGRLELGYQGDDQNGNGLVGYWPLDDTSSAPDVSGTGNDAVITGDPAEATGLFGTGAYDLDGENDYLTVPDDSSLEMDTDRVTVSAWVNIDQAQVDKGSGWKAIFQKSDRSYNLQFDNAIQPEFTIYDDNWHDAGYGDVVANQWFHYVGVYDGDEVKLYVDGSRESTNDNAGYIADSNGHPAGIGENLDQTGRHLDGQIDEVRVYDRALSDSEVRSLYAAHKTGSMTTDWRGGPAIRGENVAIRYDADIDSSETVRVRVESADGLTTSGPKSDWVTLSDGAGEISVSGLPNGMSADRYRLEIELQSDSPRHAPAVDSLEVVDDS